MSATTMTGVHPFQQSGLGTAPFFYVGMNEIVLRHPDGSTQAAGTCDHCGACIRYAFSIRSTDGKISKVGSDCICKLNRDDNRFIDKVEAEVRKLKRAASQAANKKRKEQGYARTQAMYARITSDESVRETLASHPHPRAFEGLTLLDWATWMMKNAGLRGMLEVCRVVDKILDS